MTRPCSFLLDNRVCVPANVPTSVMHIHQSCPASTTFCSPTSFKPPPKCVHIPPYGHLMLKLEKDNSPDLLPSLSSSCYPLMAGQSLQSCMVPNKTKSPFPGPGPGFRKALLLSRISFSHTLVLLHPLVLCLAFRHNYKAQASILNFQPVSLSIKADCATPARGATHIPQRHFPPYLQQPLPPRHRIYDEGPVVLV